MRTISVAKLARPAPAPEPKDNDTVLAAELARIRDAIAANKEPPKDDEAIVKAIMALAPKAQKQIKSWTFDLERDDLTQRVKRIVAKPHY
jgi:hypothetical protein